MHPQAHIATVTPIAPKRRGRPTSLGATIARNDEAPTVPTFANLVDYVYIAVRNLPAAVIGAVIGAWIPIAIFGTLHCVDFTHLSTWDESCVLNWARIVLALCGLAYSIPSVREVIRQTGKSARQATFFTLLTEGVMALPLSGATIGEALQIAALCVLCACNALSMATVLTRGSRELALRQLRKLASKGVAAP